MSYTVEHPCNNCRLSQIYGDMKRRCYQKGDKDYKSYGAKGIGMCPEWKCSYVSFRTWALENGYTDEMTIDRIDPTKDYCPENCRWIPWFENVTRNAKPITAWGETKYIWEWFDDDRCQATSKNLIRNRLNSQWEPENAIGTPVRQTLTQNLTQQPPELATPEPLPENRTDNPQP